jgi:hypothetical protein
MPVEHHARLRKYFAMRIFVRCLVLLGCLAALAGCSQYSERNRPNVYRGGQYDGDAVHASTTPGPPR